MKRSSFFVLLSVLMIGLLAAAPKPAGINTADENKAHFSCKIGGEAWEAEKAVGSHLNEKKGKTILVNGSSGKYPEVVRAIGIGIKNEFNGPGTYSIGTYSCKSKGEMTMNVIQEGVNTVYSSLACKGSVTITTVDTEAKTVSGTFEVTLTHSDDGTEVQLTEGKFEHVPLFGM